MVRLERDSQLLIPMYDYCMPTRECAGGDEDGDDDPCEIFRQIRFPVGEFFPPSTLPGMEEEENCGGGASCSCCPLSGPEGLGAARNRRNRLTKLWSAGFLLAGEGRT